MSVYEGINLRKQAQTERDPRRNDEVENNAGGFVFAINAWDVLDRFLILGTENGTYYVKARELTLDNTEKLTKLIEEDGHKFVDRVVELSTAGRAPKNDPALFALALAAASKNLDTRSHALENLNRVARTGTHLFHFNAYVQNFRGWGRGLRRGVGNWYLEKDNDRLAYQVIKYRQRDGWTHRDVLRKSHPQTEDPIKAGILGWVAGNQPAEHPTIAAFEEVQNSDNLARIIELVKAHGLPWEAVPDKFINEPQLWEALIENIGQTALIRQLGRMTKIGLIAPLSDTALKVAEMIRDQERLNRGRIHPIQVLLAHRAYSGDFLGGGLYGYREVRAKEFAPVASIVEALDDAFYLSFENLEPANKKTVLALDVSGSMQTPVIGSNFLTARDASAAMAMIAVRTEPQVHTLGFTGGGFYGRGKLNPNHLTHLNLTKRDSLSAAVKKVSDLPFGATDCALPMVWATANNVEVETFQVFTDNETWAGNVKPHQALEEYRQKMGIDAKMIVHGTASNDFTIADPRDKGMLDIVGFDASAAKIAADFSAGRI